MAACGGNGICSTCRVEVIEGLDQLAPRSDAEMLLAERRRWPDNIRLAVPRASRAQGASP